MRILVIHYNYHIALNRVIKGGWAGANNKMIIGTVVISSALKKNGESRGESKRVDPQALSACRGWRPSNQPPKLMIHDKMTIFSLVLFCHFPRALQNCGLYYDFNTFASYFSCSEETPKYYLYVERKEE